MRQEDWLFFLIAVQHKCRVLFIIPTFDNKPSNHAHHELGWLHNSGVCMKGTQSLSHLVGSRVCVKESGRGVLDIQTVFTFLNAWETVDMALSVLG